MVRLSSDLPLKRNEELRPMILRSGILRKHPNQFFRQAVRKIVVGGVSTGVDQRQHCNRFRDHGTLVRDPFAGAAIVAAFGRKTLSVIKPAAISAMCNRDSANFRPARMRDGLR